VRILILDDSDMLRSAVANMLRAMGYEVDSIAAAAEAVRMVEKTEYDFILVDYMMPVNDGIWFMKNAKLPRKTKVLLMTAYTDNNVITEMFKLGAVGYIIKPFDCEDLARHLDFHKGQTGGTPPQG
jgi:DNA-binding response OmpR family regulator